MTVEEAGIHKGSLVVLKPFGTLQTLEQRLFRLGHWLSPGARSAAVGVWPGYAIVGRLISDGAWHQASTADIERRAEEAELQRVIENRPRG